MDSPGQFSAHAAPVDAVFDRLGAEMRGLNGREALRRREECGPNRLPEPQRRSVVVRFISHFNNILIFVLLGAAAVTAALAHYIDTGVIPAVVIANAIVGFVQEGRAEQAMSAIRDMLSPRSAALRDGRRISVDAAAVVPGNVVLVEAGDRVPADAALGDRTSILVSGTLVVFGTGHGLVVATGRNSEIGHISGMLARVRPLTTPLVRQMAIFARWLTVFILIAAAIIIASSAAIAAFVGLIYRLGSTMAAV